MLTLEQLITVPTEDEVLQTLLTGLGQLGFQVTSWQSGSAQLTLLRIFARVFSAAASTVRLIAAGGFTTLAATTDGASPYLTLLAKYVYDLERLEAQPTIGQILLTSSAGAPVHTWSAGDIIVSNAAEGTDGALTFTCTEAGSLGPNSSVSIEFKADVAGAASNIPPATPLFLWTPLVGVTATCPALLPASNTWITTPGEDEESDARLLARCFGRWARLSYSNIEGAYKAWALEALPALTRVTIAAAAGDGTVRIIGATSLGPISPTQCTTIENYVNGVTDGIGRRPINDIVNADPAVVVTSPAITIDALVIPSVADTAGPAIQAALLSYLGSIPIGGVRLAGLAGVVIFSELVRIAQSIDGVRSVDFNIDDNIILAEDQIYTPVITVNVSLVSPGGI